MEEPTEIEALREALTELVKACEAKPKNYEAHKMELWRRAVLRPALYQARVLLEPVPDDPHS